MGVTLLHTCLAIMIAAAAGATAAAGAPADPSPAVVKIFTLYNRPNYHEPWQRWGQKAFHGSGAVIEGGRILTNAHVVSDQVFVQVRRAGDATKYTAEVAGVGHDCDLAILTVRDPAFFRGVTPLPIGELVDIRDRVAVYGFPEGGDKLSITEGVVSRVEHTNYAHSGAYLLTCQMDASINAGSSGGPVIRDGRIAGVAFQGLSHRDYENIGYMVPAPLIRHFLADIADGRFDGFPDLGASMQKMENPDLRRRHAMGPDRSGVLVNRIYPDSPALGRLAAGDVITAIEGQPVANDGTIAFRPGRRTFFGVLMQQKYIGETLRLDILHHGAPRVVDVPLTRPLGFFRLVPNALYDRAPTYLIAGGFVFAPLTLNYLKEYGEDHDWFVHAPKELLHYYLYGEPSPTRRQLVILTKVLADEVNVGYHEIENAVVDRVNGRTIASMDDLVRALDEQTGPYHEVRDVHGYQLVLDREKAARRLPRILARYGIDRDRSDDLR